MDEEERKMERTKERKKGSSREPLRLTSEENRRVAENAVFCKILRLKDECEQRKVKPFLFSLNGARHSTLNVFPHTLAHSGILPIQSLTSSASQSVRVVMRTDTSVPRHNTKNTSMPALFLVPWIPSAGGVSSRWD